MSYQVLARKYRPKNFSEIVGQEHVLRTLTNALNQNRLHHAYLLTGTRGVGKTTLARILAKCFNCEIGVTSTPCGICASCIGIDTGKFIDLIEIDAASRTKVEDMRDILQNVQYTPTHGRFKIYLIDEVHMLSGHSFNALLKTLEEPPAHVKFLLATTDKQKLPITILSRCLQFNLKNLPIEKIQTHLEKILQNENIPYEKEALRHIASAAQGSVRDALSLLDQAIAYGANSVNNAEVNVMLGVVEQDKLLRLCKALAACNFNEIFTLINEFAELATDFASVLDELLVLLQRIACIQVAPDLNIASWENVSDLKLLAQQISKEDVQLYYQIALIGKRDLYLAPNPKIGFEMILLRMLAFDLDDNDSQGENQTSLPQDKENPVVENQKYVNKNSFKINELKKETPISDKNLVKTQITEAENNKNKITVDELASYDELMPYSASNKENHIKDPIETVNSVLAQAAITPSQQSTQKLDLITILPKLQVTGPTLALLHHCVISKLENGILELQLEPSQSPFLNKRHIERLNQVFSEYFKQSIIVEVKIGKPNQATIANINTARKQQKHIEAGKALAEDQFLQQIISTFDAKIIHHQDIDET